MAAKSNNKIANTAAKDKNDATTTTAAAVATTTPAARRSTITAVPSSEYRKPGRLMMLLCTVLCILYARLVLTPHWLVPPRRHPIPGLPVPFEVVCWILRIFSAVLFVLTAAVVYVMGRMFRPPLNFPSHESLALLRKSRKASLEKGLPHKIVACFGDSLLHGTLSANVVDRLLPAVQKELDSQETKWELTNISQNSCVSQVIADHRVELVAGSGSRNSNGVDADYAIVLIGTQDACAIYRPADWGADLKRAWKETSENMLDFSPKKEVSFSTQQYKANMATIVQRLLETSPTRQVALVTIPPLGEHWKIKPNQVVKQLNDAIHQVVKEQQQQQQQQHKQGQGQRVQVLDLHEKLKEMVNAAAASSSGGGANKKVIVDECFSHTTTASFLHYVLGMSFNAISKRNGLEVLSDTVHLNERGANVLLDLLVQWIAQCEKKAAKLEEKKKTK